MKAFRFVHLEKVNTDVLKYKAQVYHYFLFRCDQSFVMLDLRLNEKIHARLFYFLHVLYMFITSIYFSLGLV